MTTYSMTPINNGTRLRKDHNVFALVIDVDTSAANVQSFNAGDVLTGDDLWEAPADGAEVKRLDKWVHVTHRNGVRLPESGWTALVHKGVPVCNNFKVVETTPPPIDPVVQFPQSYILTDNDPKSPKYGKRAEYIFVKELP